MEQELRIKWGVGLKFHTEPHDSIQLQWKQCNLKHTNPEHRQNAYRPEVETWSLTNSSESNWSETALQRLQPRWHHWQVYKNRYLIAEQCCSYPTAGTDALRSFQNDNHRLIIPTPFISLHAGTLLHEKRPQSLNIWYPTCHVYVNSVNSIHFLPFSFTYSNAWFTEYGLSTRLYYYVICYVMLCWRWNDYKTVQ